METTKQTYKRINTFLRSANLVLTQEIDGNKLPKGHKLAHALNRVLPKCQEAMTEYNEKVEDIDNKHASVDKEGNVIRDSFGYKFTKDELQKRTSEIRTVFKTEEVEVPQYFATDVPEWLPYETRAALVGFVLKEDENLVE